MDPPDRPETFPQHAHKADSTRVLAANQGLYNGFLAAGLLYAVATGSREFSGFFLACGGSGRRLRAWTVNNGSFRARLCPHCGAGAVATCNCSRHPGENRMTGNRNYPPRAARGVRAAAHTRRPRSSDRVVDHYRVQVISRSSSSCLRSSAVIQPSRTPSSSWVWKSSDSMSLFFSAFWNLRSTGSAITTLGR